MIRLSRACLAFFALAFASPSRGQSIRGFPTAMQSSERQLEATATAVPNADTLRARLRLLSEDPHHAGSEGSRVVAERILARFKAVGLDAKIERFEAMMPVPVTRTLELIAPERYTAKLQEPPLARDKDSNDAGQLPTYNAYSPDGDVTAEVVYVNYGTPEDYAKLDSLGVSVEGKIVLARYGRSWRGIKPKVAAEHGAVATIIYSDPSDDGFFAEDVYPEGPMRPEQGVQRGSVMDMPTYPGDPLSPGWASEAGARKLEMSEVRTFSPIPVLPISYGDALPLLRNLGGPVAPESWRGALGITYHVGAGPSRVHLALKFDWQTRPLYDVIARIPGATTPDQWIIHGNHHDAWVNGAEDPLSGMVALEETARSLGALLKTGWRPARTIILAAWDGEEWGLLGSTEWAEKHQEELRTKAVVYLNSDTNSERFLSASGSHSLQAFVREIARDMRDPKTGKSVLETMLEHRLERRSERADSTFSISALGSGSDYTAFLDFLNIASLNLSYGDGGPSGIYHSIYDSFDFYTRFKDPTFAYGVLESRTMTTALLRLANAPVLPFEFTEVAMTYGKYVDEITKGAADQAVTKTLDLGAVRAAVERLGRAAARWESALARTTSWTPADAKRQAKKLAAINAELYATERALGDAAGLDQREWFRHLIYAPGFYTGYGVKTMPGIREAVEDRPDVAVAQREAARVADALGRYADRVENAATLLEAIGS